ncbi:hypothetical protein JIN84_02545 [Luteolibacter yonseiensis]|uniref:Uncharacterized protein n=1 Tax=Luteolibacter yonseiensis TaxID=1144680 RepID=A0A934V9T2_9BACT|nr:hypothetical protein [Luteolibacter yonseiensis]MBK1814475.1 hypothetical protein [Luteolibacter yonseiensis]
MRQTQEEKTQETGRWWATVDKKRLAGGVPPVSVFWKNLMKHQNLGIGLLKIGSFLYATRYIAAALLMGPRQNMELNDWVFNEGYRLVGGELTFFAFASVLCGVAVLAYPYVRGIVRKLQNDSEK